MTTHYSLAPGVVLDANRSGQLHLCRVTSDGRLLVPREHIPIIEAAALGEAACQAPPTAEPEGADATADYLGGLVEQQWLVQGGSPSWPIMEAGLRRLDRRFSWTGALDLPGYDAAVELHAGRRRLRRSLGQYPAMPETVARRASLLGGKKLKVLALGDDDLLGMVLAGLGHQVVSVDADPHLVKYIQKTSAERGLTLDSRLWDFRQSVPEDLLDRFDVVFTDPMSSAACLPLFTDRALACTRQEGRIFVCVNHPAAALFDQHRRETRVTLNAHHTDFNHYYTTFLTLSPYTSDLYELGKGAAAGPNLGPAEGFYGTGLYDEQRYGMRPASRFVLKDINLELSELLHLRTLVEEALNVLDMELVDEALEWSEDVRTYVALLPGGRVVCIAVHIAHRLCELFTSPRHEDIERVFEVGLMSLFGGGDVAHKISRVRGGFGSTLP